MNWLDNLENIAEHGNYTFAAIELYKNKYPGVPVDITQAQIEYAVMLGLPKHYFKLSYIRPQSYQGIDCEECGGVMVFEPLPACPRSNPRGYYGVIICDNCLNHWFLNIDETRVKGVV